MSSLSPHPPSSALPHAGPSSPRSRVRSNPQFTNEPYFAYPRPTEEQVDAELPPYWEDENVALGAVLDRLVRKGHGDMQRLLRETPRLPPLNPRERSKPIIDYAKTQRQAVLKYLAVLRWKTSVDVPTTSSPPAVSNALQNGQNGAASFATPQTNSTGESNGPSPAAALSTPGYTGKGKGKAIGDAEHIVRGRVTDAKRIQQFFAHANHQHEAAVNHLKHSVTVVERLRERNPDLLTAIDLLTLGAYPSLPSQLTETFRPPEPLTNARVLATLRRLNECILYRLRCVDYLPPEVEIRGVKDGRAYISGEGWRADISLYGQGDDARWWMTGFTWDQETGEHQDNVSISGEEGGKSQLQEHEKQWILDIANVEILPPRSIGRDEPPDSAPPTRDVSRMTTPAPKLEKARSKIDAPLVRLHNFLRHLSLSYQLERMYDEACTLSRGRWRGQLIIEIDRAKKVLSVRYWVRPRPINDPQKEASRVAPNRRVHFHGGRRQAMVGGTITVSLTELPAVATRSQAALSFLTSADADSSDRVVQLGLEGELEVGELGVGGGWKAGDVQSVAGLEKINQMTDFATILSTVTRFHAAHLLRAQTAPLTTSPRIILSPSNPPAYTCSDNVVLPDSLQIPIPSYGRASSLFIAVSGVTGRLTITDSSTGSTLNPDHGSSAGQKRLKDATAGVNDRKESLLDAVAKVLSAILLDNIESQLQELGRTPIRQIPLRSSELAKAELSSTSTLFISVPSSASHYFVVRVAAHGIAFELLRLVRIPGPNGVGTRLSIGERSPLDIKKLREKREPLSRAHGSSGFQVEDGELRDLLIFANVLVAQTIVEQQLKDRGIPYALRYPSSSAQSQGSSSVVSSMVPTLVVRSADLLKDGRAVDVAMPNVFLQITDWWKGGKCKITTTMQLRHRPSMSSPADSPGAPIGPTRPTESEGIVFDQSSSIVRFMGKDVAGCVPIFLERWERLSKVIVVAGEVNRLNKTAAFRDLKMLSFDLRTAIFIYSPGYIASITYSPNSDTYEVSFPRSAHAQASVTGQTSAVATPGPGMTPQAGLTPAGFTPGTGLTPGPGQTPAALTPGITPGTASTPGMHAGPSPHEPMAGLLSWWLNQLVLDHMGTRGLISQLFFALLRDTLPLLNEIATIRTLSSSDFPSLVIRSVHHYRLIWDVGSSRHALDIRLLPSSRFLLADPASLQVEEDDISCGPLTPIGGFASAVDKVYVLLREEAAKDKREMDSTGRRKGVVIKVDGGKGLVVGAEAIGDAVRKASEEVERAMGIRS